MTLLRHELRQGRRALLIWTAAVSFFFALCVFLYPDMRGEMESVGDIFASMGSFTAAFGMDRLNFGTLTGYYAVECGNVLGLGGAFYAALTAVSALAGEEREHTAEFLLSHPISRAGIVTGKLAAVLLRILFLNAVVLAVAVLSVAAIGESFSWRELGLLHLAYFLVQLVLAGFCFSLSAFLRRGSAGVGLGVAVAAYFLNLAANIAERAAFLKYVTPFGIAESADILGRGGLEWKKLLPSAAAALLLVAAAYRHYGRKDIR